MATAIPSINIHIDTYFFLKKYFRLPAVFVTTNVEQMCLKIDRGVHHIKKSPLKN